jgi:hypothetical protein
MRHQLCGQRGGCTTIRAIGRTILLIARLRVGGTRRTSVVDDFLDDGRALSHLPSDKLAQQ